MLIKIVKDDDPNADGANATVQYIDGVEKTVEYGSYVVLFFAIRQDPVIIDTNLIMRYQVYEEIQ